MKIVPSSKPKYSRIVLYRNKKDRISRIKLAANNAGQESTGIYNGKIILEQDNLFRLSDAIYIIYTHDLADEGEKRNSQSIYSSIDIPFGRWNFSTSHVNSSYLNTIKGTNQEIQTSGKSNFLSFKLQRNIFRNKINNIKLFTSLNLKGTESFIEDVKSETGSRRLSIAEGGLNHTISSDIGYISYNLSYVEGLDRFGAKEDVDVRSDFIPRAQYSKYTFNISYYNNFNISNHSLSFQSYFSSQYSNDPLFSSEQISIGDTYSVRGFKEKSALGDSGYYITNNLNYRLPSLTDEYNINYILSRTQIFVGYDFGSVSQVGGREASFGEGRGVLSGRAVGIKYQGEYVNFDITHSSTIKTERYIEPSEETYINLSLRIF